VGPRAGLNGRKISSTPGFDPGPSSPYSVAIPTELPGPHSIVFPPMPPHVLVDFVVFPSRHGRSITDF